MRWQTAGRLFALVLFGATLVALAVSQARVIHDVVQGLHGSAWPIWATWAMAGGYEGAILCVAFGLAVLGRDEGWGLWVAEVGLVGLSIAAGAIGGYRAGHDLYVVAVVSLMPLQYLAVAEAGRRVLLRWWPPGPQGEPAQAGLAARPRAPRARTAPVAAPMVLPQALGAVSGPAVSVAPAPAAAPPTAPVDAGLTPERRRLATEYAAAAARVGDSPALVADALGGKAARTIRRWRQDALALGLIR